MPEIKFPLFNAEEKYHEAYLIMIDILGFSNAIIASEFRTIYDTIADIFNMRDDGNITFSLQDEQYNLAKSGQQFTGGKFYKPRITIFSDTIFICIPDDALVEIPKDIVPSHRYIEFSAHHILFQMCYYIWLTQRSLLKHGFLSRGAMSYGQIYTENGMWFGPAIIHAAKSEKEEAIYPRVILHKTVFEKLKITTLQSAKSDIVIDSDGKHYCDYLAFDNVAEITNQEILQITINQLTHLSDERAKEKWQWLHDKLKTSVNAVEVTC